MPSYSCQQVAERLAALIPRASSLDELERMMRVLVAIDDPRHALLDVVGVVGDDTQAESVRRICIDAACARMAHLSAEAQMSVWLALTDEVDAREAAAYVEAFERLDIVVRAAAVRRTPLAWRLALIARQGLRPRHEQMLLASLEDGDLARSSALLYRALPRPWAWEALAAGGAFSIERAREMLRAMSRGELRSWRERFPDWWAEALDALALPLEVLRDELAPQAVDRHLVRDGASAQAALELVATWEALANKREAMLHDPAWRLAIWRPWHEHAPGEAWAWVQAMHAELEADVLVGVCQALSAAQVRERAAWLAQLAAQASHAMVRAAACRALRLHDRAELEAVWDRGWPGELGQAVDVELALWRAREHDHAWHWLLGQWALLDEQQALAAVEIAIARQPDEGIARARLFCQRWPDSSAVAMLPARLVATRAPAAIAAALTIALEPNASPAWARALSAWPRAEHEETLPWLPQALREAPERVARTLAPEMPLDQAMIQRVARLVPGSLKRRNLVAAATLLFEPHLLPLLTWLRADNALDTHRRVLGAIERTGPQPHKIEAVADFCADTDRSLDAFVEAFALLVRWGALDEAARVAAGLEGVRAVCLSAQVTHPALSDLLYERALAGLDDVADAGRRAWCMATLDRAPSRLLLWYDDAPLEARALSEALSRWPVQQVRAWFHEHAARREEAIMGLAWPAEALHEELGYSGLRRAILDLLGTRAGGLEHVYDLVIGSATLAAVRDEVLCGVAHAGHAEQLFARWSAGARADEAWAWLLERAMAGEPLGALRGEVARGLSACSDGLFARCLPWLLARLDAEPDMLSVGLVVRLGGAVDWRRRCDRTAWDGSRYAWLACAQAGDEEAVGQVLDHMSGGYGDEAGAALASIADRLPLSQTLDWLGLVAQQDGGPGIEPMARWLACSSHQRAWEVLVRYAIESTSPSWRAGLPILAQRGVVDTLKVRW